MKNKTRRPQGPRKGRTLLLAPEVVQMLQERYDH